MEINERIKKMSLIVLLRMAEKISAREYYASARKIGVRDIQAGQIWHELQIEYQGLIKA